MRFLEAIALLLPVAARARYIEEWRADLDGAHELGLPAISVVWGALRTAASMDRRAPSVTGISQAVLSHRRWRWAATATTCGVVAAGGALFWSLSSHGALTSFGAVVLQTVALALFIGAAAAAVGGTLATVRVGHRFVLTLQGAAIVAILAAAGFLGVPPATMALAASASVAGACSASAVLARQDDSKDPTRNHRLAVAGFTLALVSTVAWGMTHALVWNPMARIPDRDLAEIFRQMATAGQNNGAGFVVGWGVLWLTMGAVYLSLMTVSPLRNTRTRTAVIAGLALVAGACVTSWLAAAALGANLADTFPVAGADAAISGMPLAAVGQLALLLLAALTLPPPALKVDPAT